MYSPGISANGARYRGVWLITFSQSREFGRLTERVRLMTTIAYARSGGVQHEVDTEGSTPERPVTFCGRSIGDRWTAREGEPNCKKCENTVTRMEERIEAFNASPQVWENPLADIQEFIAKIVAATPPAHDVYAGSDDNPAFNTLESLVSDKPYDTLASVLTVDTTTEYHTNRGTPPVGAYVWTPNGFGQVYQWYGPNSVLVEHSDLRIEVYLPEQVRRLSPLTDMPQKRVRHPYRPMRSRRG